MNEYLAQFRKQYPQYADMADPALLRALHEKFYADMTFEQFTAKVGEAGPVNTGPSAQPPFATLPPMVGGALDALVAFGVGAGMGVPLLSKDTREYVAELKGRAPRATAGTAAVGGAAAGLASGPLFAARTAMTGPYSVALGGPSAQAIPSIAGSAARTVGSAAARGTSAVADILRNRAMGALGIGGSGLMGYLLGRR